MPFRSNASLAPSADSRVQVFLTHPQPGGDSRRVVTAGLLAPQHHTHAPRTNQSDAGFPVPPSKVPCHHARPMPTGSEELPRVRTLCLCSLLYPLHLERCLAHNRVCAECTRPHCLFTVLRANTSASRTPDLSPQLPPGVANLPCLKQLVSPTPANATQSFQLLTGLSTPSFALPHAWPYAGPLGSTFNTDQESATPLHPRCRPAPAASPG